MGRTAQVGDELGTQILSARLARDVIRLAFLQEREHAPYIKWLGSAFPALPISGPLTEALTVATSVATASDRVTALARAYELVAHNHNQLAVTEPLDPTTHNFHDRPFPVLGADRFADACFAAIDDSTIRQLPRIGSIDQWIDTTDILGHRQELCRRALAVYGLEVRE